MDPVFFLIFMTLFGSVGLKAIEGFLMRPKAVLYGKEAGPMEVNAHNTRMLEKEIYPDWHEDWYTPCDCLKCNPPVPPKGPAVVYPLPKRGAMVTHTNHKNLVPGTRFYHERVVDGYVFNVPNSVPEEAKAWYDHKYMYGVFTWYNPDGKTQSLKLIPRMEVEPAYYRYDNNNGKPMLALAPRRASNIEIKTSPYHRQGLKERNDQAFEQLMAYHRKELIKNANIPAPRIGTEKAYK